MDLGYRCECGFEESNWDLFHEHLKSHKKITYQVAPASDGTDKLKTDGEIF